MVSTVRAPISLFFLFLAGAAAASCGSSTPRETFDDPNKAPAPTGPAPTTPPLTGSTSPSVDVTFSGTVYSPNGSLPLSNALVYVTSKQPDAIPSGAYCDECVTLPEDTFAVSAPDGAFEIKTRLPVGKTFLVVQKGQFRRVRAIEIKKEGTIAVDKADSTLPGRSDPAKGDDIPKMVILKDDADFDAIDLSLDKLGVPGIEIRTDRKLLENESELMKYQIVFVPCGESDDPISASGKAIANVQKFVEAGGKLYVTDWSYEFVRKPFGNYLSWEGETSTLGSAASGNEWDAPATAQDQGLADWLAATGDKSFTVQGNWTTITNVNTMPGKDPKGKPADIEPKVWVTAKKGNQIRPTTVSFQQQCGRVLFSSYHTEASVGGTGGSALLAQEKALLYVLLEVGVCVGDRPTTR